MIYVDCWQDQTQSSKLSFCTVCCSLMLVLIVVISLRVANEAGRKRGVQVCPVDLKYYPYRLRESKHNPDWWEILTTFFITSSSSLFASTTPQSSYLVCNILPYGWWINERLQTFRTLHNVGTTVIHPGVRCLTYRKRSDKN